MNVPKRICFYGGPASGKSTIGARLFADLKQTGLRVEYAVEHVKNWTFIDREMDGWDQPYLLGRQIQYSHYPLKKGADVVVEESPPELNSWYAEYFKLPIAGNLMNVAWQYSEKYPTLHIFLLRNDNFYDNFGRFQNLKEARNIDTSIYSMLSERVNMTNNSCGLWSVSPTHYDSFLEDVKKVLKLNG